MGKSKKQQLAEELGKNMTAVVIKVKAEPVVDDEESRYDLLENELDRYRTDLKETRKMLNTTRRELARTRRQLELTDNDYQMTKRVADKAILILKNQLMKWLSRDSQLQVEHFLRFYHQDDQLDLLEAMMAYVVLGKKTKLEKVVAQWHFRLFCNMMDGDRYTVPSHSLLVRLWKKIGLLEGIDN